MASAAPAHGPAVEVRVLGRLEVVVGGRAVDPGTPKQRMLLAVLIAEAGRTVPVDRLVDALWEGGAPRTARKNVQVYVSGLRKLLAERIVSGAEGYMCRIGPDECDLPRFLQLAAAGRRAARGGDPETAARVLGGAVRLWRERAFADLPRSAWLAAECDRLQDRYLAAYEDWAELEIQLGRHVEALDGLDELAVRFPERERLSVCRMTALARCGRTGEALAHFDRLRQSLARDLGIEPSPVLRGLYRRLLSGQDAALWHSAAGAAGSAPAPTGVHQLPRRLADFVGRGAELDRILDVRAEVSVICGRPGTGKSALAVQAAHLLRESYPDGELLLRLRDAAGRPLTAAEAVRAALRATSLRSCLPDDDAGVLPLWQSWISDRRMVVLADDAPDEASVDALLPGTDSCRILVTSHRKLSALSCAQRINLGDFDQAEAFELLGAVLGPARVRGGHGAVCRLLEDCGASPRTVRALGNRLAAQPHLPIAEFADRIGALHDPLDELAAGDGSLRGEFERWFRNLPRLHQWSLRRLARLPQPVFGYEDAVRALSRGARRPDLVVESLIEANILSAPEYEVSAHAVLFDIPRPARQALSRRRAEPAVSAPPR